MVKSKGYKEHLADLRETLECTRKHGLKMNPNKCAFGVSAGQFLGFMVHVKGIEIGFLTKPMTTNNQAEYEAILKGLQLLQEVNAESIKKAKSQKQNQTSFQKCTTEKQLLLKKQPGKAASLEVIELGATQIIIPGNFPIGCSPSYLSLFSVSGAGDLDDRGCLKSYNAFAQHHNELLQAAIDGLRKANTDVSIVYADYYGAFMHLLDHASLLGFDQGALLQACCGAGGAYNFHMNMMCGAAGTSVCADPARRVSWDGIHLTQQAYRAIALSLLMEGFAQPADAVQEIWSC
ncbi:GDSL esterase/lipase At5g03980-like [Miscanthus floridulus]|uniref:GDSL esterase/lipase At5g03980-like n=1 Tax=Miscanthus floridulus TaxID=154761 RepID=UPI00345905EC